MSLWFQHIACVLAYIALCVFVIRRAKAIKDPATFRNLELTLALLAALASIAVNIWWLRPAKFTLTESLPLQLCDLAGLIAPFALLTRARPLRTLLHFWAFALSSQWVFTPVSPTGPDTLAFWISFILHASILGSAWFDFFARGYRPTWPDWRFAVIVSVIYSAFMVLLNIKLSSNYGYLGNSTPHARTLINILGPWPLRTLWIAALGILALTLVKLFDDTIDRFWGRPFGMNRGLSAEC